MGRDYTEDYAYWRESWDEHEPASVRVPASYIREPVVDRTALDEHSDLL